MNAYQRDRWNSNQAAFRREEVRINRQHWDRTVTGWLDNAALYGLVRSPEEYDEMAAALLAIDVPILSPDFRVKLWEGVKGVLAQRLHRVTDYNARQYVERCLALAY